MKHEACHGVQCPMCNQAVRIPTVEVVIQAYGLTKRQGDILRAVWRGKGMPVPTRRIFDVMYADDPDGGPSETQMYSAFKVALCHMRKSLLGSGISLVSAGYGRGIRLVIEG